ncbi:WD-40 repeat-containing protein [Reticulomyxa filosa]|uniref:WD-40 repeat-containing protein n=1 Tax=Reticulomyxa filosa TaxID=46433 RepID=X6NZF5_RETFI|nr:WD-40 repeat-containing protein [Reticulomyxa filosa]|eukprot:ETO31263.1 WD-40 repeat-containing protein [Reticulomyxa filosa]
MTTAINEKQNSTQLTLVIFIPPGEEEIQIIIRYWIRTLKIKLGWVQDFDKIVVKYVMFIYYLLLSTVFLFMFETFNSFSKLLNNFTVHTKQVSSIDYSTFNGIQLICSGSSDKTVCVWDINSNKQLQSLDGHTESVNCAKFSQYYYNKHCRNIICSASDDNTIRLWDFKHNQQLQLFNEHKDGVYGIEFSSFNSGRYLCSASLDNTIHGVLCVDMSPEQSSNNIDDNTSSSVSVIGGNGYTICSGSCDNTIRIWDIETTKQFIVLKGHTRGVCSVKYGSNRVGNIGCANTILSGSDDCCVRLWDIRSGNTIQEFYKHIGTVFAVDYSPFVIKNSIEVVGDNSNVICSGSWDNTIRFWDIRSNKIELRVISRYDKDDGVTCYKFVKLKDKVKENENCFHLYYGSYKGPIYVRG